MADVTGDLAAAGNIEGPPARLSEISRLATLLADRVLDAQIMKRPVLDDDIRSLLDAGLLLKEYGFELPSLLGQIMLAAEISEPDVCPKPETDAEEVGRLAWLLRPFKGEKG
ncbi:hypothetical protein [Methylobacterium sp. Leaf87]|uniref:hypothetical protein n=1 Tax=Methylobacterium sp. Leaf87 TaxID=1736243 RepID=UPI000AF41EEF|nr:hypothetical protein [Methylobacterium sp. Leaf87]